jgi:signal transduction histidine kinase
MVRVARPERRERPRLARRERLHRHQLREGVARSVPPGRQVVGGLRMSPLAGRGLADELRHVATHAGSCRVRVRAAFDAQDFCLTIVDDGVGFSVDPDSHAFGGHWGLVGMREQASEAGGSLLVRSAPGAGTEVTLRLGYGEA